MRTQNIVSAGRSKFSIHILLFSLVGCFTLRDANGQNVTGAVTGTVADETGGILPGVTVVVENPSRGIRRGTVTNDNGQFMTSLLPVGEYRLSAELPGFKSVSVSGIVVQVDEVVRVDLTMSLGEMDERVTVEADAFFIGTKQVDLGEVIDSVRLESLPLNTRQFAQLVSLQSGAGEVLGGGTGGSLGATVGGPMLILNGQLMQHNQYAIDGTFAQDRFYNTLSVSPSMDAVQEFKVLTGTASAEFGGFTGAFVNVSIKGGTNNFHGSLFHYLRNDVLDARNFFDRGDPPPFRQNQFGASIGGPVVRDRVFFFFNWESLRRRKGTTQQYVVPTAAMRTGDLSEFPTLLPTLGLPIDPLTGDFFPDNRIPEERLSPVARELFRYIPLPNVPGSLNFISARSLSRDDNQINVRGDYQLSDATSFFGRYTWSSIEEIVPSMAPEFDPFNTNYAHNMSAGFTRIFSPTFLNEFRFGINHVSGGQDFLTKGIDFAAASGMQGLTSEPDLIGVPGFSFGPFSGAGLPAIRTRRNNYSFQFVDNMSLSRGSHNLKFGASYIWHKFDPLSEIWARGAFTYNGFYTGLGNPAASSGFADFLLGRPSQGIFGAGDNRILARASDFGIYFQDDWDVARNLTLNLGLRWEYYSPPGDARHEQTTAVFRDPATPWAVVPASMNPAAIAVPMNIPIKTNEEVGLPRELVHRFWNQYAPRLGFSYTPFGDQKTVIRGGFGLFYVNPALNKVSHMHFAAPLFDLRFEFNQFNPNPLTDRELFATSPADRQSNSIYPLAEDFRAGYTQQWSLGIQRALPRHMVLDINYVGNKGTHMERNRRPNQAEAGTAPVSERVRWPHMGNFQVWTTDGNSNYNALQARLERRYRGGLAWAASYTFGKGTDDGLSEGAGNQGGGFNHQDIRNLGAEKGLNPSDHNHRFVLNFVYEMPFGSALSGVSGTLLKGWVLNGIYTVSDGLPLTPVAGTDVSRTATSDRPDRVGDGNLPSSQRTPEKWFDTSAFVLPAIGSFGNAGRGLAVRGPGRNNVDFSVLKNFLIAENHRVQFRAEFFNLLNHAPLGTPGLSFVSPLFGRITSAGDAREIQFGLRYDF